LAGLGPAASFSVHAVADLLKIGKDDIESRYNKIEKEMLSSRLP
jgi:hypothetical protein